uniref:TBC1 domain family member 7 n=1 Tax=Parastrongyloides trichosuri TaxID=131310 RepID=A0A0N4ZAW1_PARTI
MSLEENSKNKSVLINASGDIEHIEPVRIRDYLEKHVLNTENDVDLQKIYSILHKHNIPREFRVVVWKYCLNITSDLVVHRDEIKNTRRSEAYAVLKSTKSFLYNEPIFNILGDQIEDKSFVTDIDAVNRVEKFVFYMAFYSKPPSRRVKNNVEYQLSLKALRCISIVVNNICKKFTSYLAEYWIDAYWLTKRMDQLLERHFPTEIDSENIKEFYYSVRRKITELQKECFADNAQAKSIVDKGLVLINDTTLVLWFRSGGANWLRPLSLYKLWDKLIIFTKVDDILEQVFLEILRAVFCTCVNSYENNPNVTALNMNFWISEDKEQKIIGNVVEKLYKNNAITIRTDQIFK